MLYGCLLRVMRLSYGSVCFLLCDPSGAERCMLLLAACCQLLAVGQWSRPQSAVSARDLRHASSSPRMLSHKSPRSAVSARDVRHASVSPRMVSHKSPKAKIMSASTSLILSSSGNDSSPLPGRFVSIPWAYQFGTLIPPTPLNFTHSRQCTIKAIGYLSSFPNRNGQSYILVKANFTFVDFFITSHICIYCTVILCCRES